jgi:hypothetical protein
VTFSLGFDSVDYFVDGIWEGGESIGAESSDSYGVEACGFGELALSSFGRLETRFEV